VLSSLLISIHSIILCIIAVVARLIQATSESMNVDEMVFNDGNVGHQYTAINVNDQSADWWSVMRWLYFRDCSIRSDSRITYLLVGRCTR
jgi:hypothetical protein